MKYKIIARAELDVESSTDLDSTIETIEEFIDGKGEVTFNIRNIEE